MPQAPSQKTEKWAGKRRSPPASQAGYLRDTDRLGAYPHHWAPFVLVGNDAPMAEAPFSHTFWAIIGILIISGIAIGLGFRYHKKQKFW